MSPMEMPVTEEAAPFWAAARERRLVLQWCTACERTIHFPRVVCPGCGGVDLEWREASGRGTVYAATVVHTRAPSRLADRAPYVLALVELEEGARMMTNVVGSDPASVQVGDAVTVTWEESGDAAGTILPVFERVEDGAG
jgi:uncharacterized protein